MPGQPLFRCLPACLFFVVAACLLAFPVRAAADPNPASLHSDSGAWPLYRQWNHAELGHFSKWIEHIYDVKRSGTVEQRLAKLERVLTDPAMNLLEQDAFRGEPSNPQLELETIRSMHQIIDCGKLTIALTGYYAYRRGLPWMNSSIRSGDGTDIRQSAYNVPAHSFSSFDYDSRHAFFVDAVYGFCTGNYRIDPFRENAELSDTVPIAIDRRYMIPGSLFYMDGHVMILAKLDEQGELYFLDSTTSPTRGIYTQHNFNAVSGITPSRDGDPVSAYSGCYRGFRMHRLPICETDETGKVVHVRRRSDEEMKAFGYSLEQYEKLKELTRTQKIREGKLALGSLHEFVRYRMRTAKQFSPVEMLEREADALLAMMRQREELVQRGWADVQANGAITFPDGTRNGNAFDAKGRWGEFATAEIDANFRMQYFQMLSAIDSAVEYFRHQPNYVTFASTSAQGWTPATLASVVSNLKTRIFKERSFTYRNSQGKTVRLSLRDVEQRLFDLSFDPNHAPELRWGAPLNSRELRTAKQSPTALPDGSTMPMIEAYQREAFYRTLTFRESEESFLRDMAASGFSVRNKLDQHLAKKYNIKRTPALVPHIDYRGGGSQALTAKAM